MQTEIIIDHGDHPKSNHQAGQQHGAKPAHAKARPAGGRPHSGLPPMQMVVQINIYRDAFSHYEYLLLKRIDEDDAFWQVVTEPVASGEALGDALRQAASQQTGLHGFKHLSHEMYSYEWYAGGQRGRDIVFAAEVASKAEVTVDRHRYEAFAWLPYAEAVQHLKWNGNKQALKQLDRHLRQQRQQQPTEATTGLYGDGSRRVINAPAPAAVAPAAQPMAGRRHPGHNPYGDNVPKRLPDVAETGIEELKPFPDEDDERTGELFL